MKRGRGGEGGYDESGEVRRRVSPLENFPKLASSDRITVVRYESYGVKGRGQYVVWYDGPSK